MSLRTGFLKCLFLFVEGGRVKTWKRRWFILTDSCLYYFEYTTVSICLPAKYRNVKHFPGDSKPKLVSDVRLLQDKDPIGIIPLEDLCVRELQDSSKPVDFSICFLFISVCDVESSVLAHIICCRMNHTAAAE